MKIGELAIAPLSKTMAFITPDQWPSPILSVHYSDETILKAIQSIYLGGERFDLDPAFSTGKFYGGLEKPKIIMDKYPQVEGVIENDILNGLPIDDDSLGSIVFDPPFMWGSHGKTGEYKMSLRFTIFKCWEDLKTMYVKSLQEFYRVLRKKGIVAFKCSDYTDTRTTLTHCFVWSWAVDCGFMSEDLFIKVNTAHGVWNSELVQRHCRKNHTYWFVFRKVVV